MAFDAMHTPAMQAATLELARLSTDRIAKLAQTAVVIPAGHEAHAFRCGAYVARLEMIAAEVPSLRARIAELEATLTEAAERGIASEIVGP